MLPVDIRDRRDYRRQFQKGPVAFISFRHNNISVTQTRIGTYGSELAADHHRRIEASLRQNSRQHRCRCGLSVAAGHGDGKFHLQKLCQHFRTRDDRNILAMSLHNLRIVAPDRGGSDHHIRIADIIRRMAVRDLRSQITQASRRFGGNSIRAADLVTEIQKNLSDAAHPDAANTDKMDALDLALHKSRVRVFSHARRLLLFLISDHFLSPTAHRRRQFPPLRRACPAWR